MNTTQSRSGALVQPGIDHKTAMRVAATEYDRMADALAQLNPDDWAKPTVCTAWDVRQLGCHMVGMAKLASSPLEMNRQMKKAESDAVAAGTDKLTALTGLQVSERDGWSPADVVAGARKVAPKAVRGRRLTPAFMRRRPVPDPQEVGGRLEDWSIGFMMDTILTRDPWMHRMVADVVAEWAGRHDAEYELELTGEAGGHWQRGTGGERLALDAIDFCRILSGRGSGDGLLGVAVPF
jgi:hypothetical protein